MKELDRRIHLGVRNIRISPLFEMGKLYNINSQSENYQKEDSEGTLRPQYNHCWLTWQSKWIDGESGKEHWGNQAYNFKTIEEAKVAEKYLEKHLK